MENRARPPASLLDKEYWKFSSGSRGRTNTGNTRRSRCRGCGAVVVFCGRGGGGVVGLLVAVVLPMI